MSNYTHLPFNFKGLQEGGYLVSNLAGQHEHLSKLDFDNLIHSKYNQIGKNSLDSLESKHFITPENEAR